MKPSSAKVLVSSFVLTSAAYAVLYGSSTRFRNWALRRNVRNLTLLQASRIVGPILFGYEYMRGRIPAAYGVTTALCDFLAGSTAPAAAAYFSENDLRRWNLLGLLGLLTSGGSGVLTSPSRAGILAGAKSSQPTVSFPLVLVPLLFGPIVLTAHLIALTKLESSATTDRKR